MPRISLAAGLCVLLAASEAQAYIEVSYTLGRVVNEATNIVLCKVEKVNKERRLIYYKKVADIKGNHPADAIKHIITDGFNPREPKFILDWAEPGKTAIFFYQGGASEMCLGDYWYQSYNQGEWWSMTHAEPYMGWCFSGPIHKLQAILPEMLAGKEVVVPCAQYDPAKIDEYKKMLQEKKCPLWRMKASLALADHAACMREKDKYVVGLGALGPEAVPNFVADLQKPDAATRLKAAFELGQIGEDAKAALDPLGKALADADAEVRTRAAEALLRIDPKVTTAVPVLVAALGDQKLRGQTAEILGSLGAVALPAKPALVEALKDQRASVTLKSAEALLRIEAASPDALQALIGLIETPRAGTAGWGPAEATDLKSANGATLTARPDRSVLVGGENPPTDVYSMNLKTDRKTVTAIKLEALTDGSLPANGPGRAQNGNFVLTKVVIEAGGKPVKAAAMWADFSQQGFDVQNVLVENNTGWAVAPELSKPHTAILTLAEPLAADAGVTFSLRLEFLSPHGQHQWGAFRVSVTDAENPLVNPRVRSVEMLGGVGAAGKTAIPTLMKLLTAEDGSLRAAASQALAQMAPDSIPVLAGALQAAQIEARLAALDALARAGGQAAPAVPALVESFKAGDKPVRLRSGELLIALGGAAAAAAPAAVAALGDPDRDVRLRSCEVLGHVGGDRAAGIPALMQMVAAPGDKDISARAAWVLGQIGPGAQAAVDNLTQATRHPERDVRLNALDALDKVRNDPKAVAPVALPLVTDPDREVRVKAAWMYGKSNPFGGGATVELFEDNHPLLLAQLTAEDGPAQGDADRFAGEASVMVKPSQRYNPDISGWTFNIAENPQAGEYRYIRFAWKKKGGNGIMLQLSTNTRGWENRYVSGKNAAGWAAIQVDENSPAEWTVVTRDLFKDFGACQLKGMALSPIDGESGHYDHIYLGRSIEELDKVTEAKKKK